MRADPELVLAAVLAVHAGSAVIAASATLAQLVVFAHDHALS